MAGEYAVELLKVWVAGVEHRPVPVGEAAAVVLQALLAPLFEAIRELQQDSKESSLIVSSLCELAYETLFRRSVAHRFFGVTLEPFPSRLATLPPSIFVSPDCSTHVIVLCGTNTTCNRTSLGTGHHGRVIGVHRGHRRDLHIQQLPRPPL